MDNLPIDLLPNVVDLILKDYDANNRPALAIGIDVRTHNFNPEKNLSILNELSANKDIELKVLFFDSQNEVLAKRFTETRRKHPLADNRTVENAIIKERELLKSLLRESHFVFDTSDLEIYETRRILNSHFRRRKSHEFGEGQMHIMVSSFGYPKGLPRDADLVFDVRFLENPHYDENLQHMTGRDQQVADFVSKDPDFDFFWTQISGLISMLLPRYEKEGKSYLTISFGCTGGKHRSVFLTEKLFAKLKSKGHPVSINHRELSKE
jgi:UPF0042 nucleotide-binding protein